MTCSMMKGGWKRTVGREIRNTNSRQLHTLFFLDYKMTQPVWLTWYPRRLLLPPEPQSSSVSVGLLPCTATACDLHPKSRGHHQLLLTIPPLFLVFYHGVQHVQELPTAGHLRIGHWDLSFGELYQGTKRDPRKKNWSCKCYPTFNNVK